MKYLWDTNVVIDYLQERFTPVAEKLIDDLLKNNQPAISAITEIELLCWRSATPSDIEAISRFISIAFVIELENSVKLKTAEIKKLHKIKLPDAIIAASASIHNLNLLTRNDKDFKGIKSLKLVNPWK